MPICAPGPDFAPAATKAPANAAPPACARVPLGSRPRWSALLGLRCASKSLTCRLSSTACAQGAAPKKPSWPSLLPCSPPPTTCSKTASSTKTSVPATSPVVTVRRSSCAWYDGSMIWDAKSNWSRRPPDRLSGRKAKSKRFILVGYRVWEVCTPHISSTSHARRFRHRTNALHNLGSDQLFALSQRHDSVLDRCDLSFAEERVSSELRTDRGDHAHLPGLCVGAAAAHRRIYRQAPQTAFAERGHGLHADRPGDLGAGSELRVGPGGGRIRRRRLGDLSPRVLTHRPPRLRRAPRPGAVDIPSRRQRGQCARAA